MLGHLTHICKDTATHTGHQLATAAAATEHYHCHQKKENNARHLLLPPWKGPWCRWPCSPADGGWDGAWWHGPVRCRHCQPSPVLGYAPEHFLCQWNLETKNIIIKADISNTLRAEFLLMKWSTSLFHSKENVGATQQRNNIYMYKWFTIKEFNFKH